MTSGKGDLETIDILLIGSEKEKAEGIREIDRLFRGKIVEVIRGTALSAKEDDWFDIYQEVLSGIHEDARDGKYDPDAKSLMGFICRIARNKAIDWLRRKKAQKRSRDVERDVLVDAVAETIKDSGIHEPWEYAHQNEERAIILKTIREIVPRLKPRQRQVAEIIIDNFQNCLSTAKIKTQIMQQYDDCEVTVPAVKSARQEVFRKVKEVLEDAGYGGHI